MQKEKRYNLILRMPCGWDGAVGLALRRLSAVATYNGVNEHPYALTRRFTGNRLCQFLQSTLLVKLE